MEPFKVTSSNKRQKLDTNNSAHEHPIHGTTIYIGKSVINTYYGEFSVYTFQDLIHKGYILALCHGDIHSETLYTRLHSSCVTSETLRSLDCDCVSQLYGAMKKIAQKNGILFYLMQEGRGCGYVGKSRACMHVQYSEESTNPINTFQAYEMLGMKHDYREYSNVKDICSMLNIKSKFILLTNNPDKIEKFNKLGLTLSSVESIEITPNPFNQQYLSSKETYGHLLYQTKTKVSKYKIPHPLMEPFVPYSLQNNQRFVHVSSYFLPIKPVWNIVNVDSECLKQIPIKSIIEKQFVFDTNSYCVKVDENVIIEKQLTNPYWFHVDVFYDIVTHHDYIVLRYGDCTKKTPVVRIHSESIFNRFPMTDRTYKRRYKKALEYIIKNGCGMIVILYNDGRGSGLGNFVLNNTPFNEQQKNMQIDRRDYQGAISLMKTFLSQEPTIDILHGLTSKEFLEKELALQNIKVSNWFDVSSIKPLGHETIFKRIIDINDRVEEFLFSNDCKNIKFIGNLIYFYSTIYVSGIGSSEAHAKYLVELLKKTHRAEYISVFSNIGSEIVHKKTNYRPILKGSTYSKLLVLFSQGMSPNSMILLKQFNYKDTVLITSVRNSSDPNKQAILDKLRKSNSNMIINYDAEIDDFTLMRVTGSYIGYIIALKISEYLTRKQISNEKFIKNTNDDNIDSESELFFTTVAKNKKLLLIVDPSILDYVQNIVNKFMEGCFISVTVCTFLNFAHGYYQLIQADKAYCYLVLKDETDRPLTVKSLVLLSDHIGKVIDYKKCTESILEIEQKTNHIVLRLMQMMKVDQINWLGRDKQKYVYDVSEN